MSTSENFVGLSLLNCIRNIETNFLGSVSHDNKETANTTEVVLTTKVNPCAAAPLHLL